MSLSKEILLLVRTLRESEVVRASSRNPLPRKIFIPIQQTRSEVKGFSITLLQKSGVIVKHLSGNCIFKGISVMDWFLLYEFVSRNVKSSEYDYFACLCGILKLSSGTRKGALRSFSSRLRPIRKIVSELRLLGANSGEESLNILSEVLSVPKQTMMSDELYSVREEMRRNPRPLPINRIGVGYKDKGSLGSGIILEPDPSETLPHVFDEKNFLTHWIEIQSS